MAANTNTVTLSTNFNVDPYYDDFDETKDYHRILYRPGLAVQGRELTQMQTILQNQIDRFGESIYKEGSVIKGIDTRFEPINFVKIRDNDSTSTSVTANNFLNLEVRGASSNVLGVVLDTATGSEAASPGLKTLFIKYIDTGSTSTTGNVHFTHAETINSVTGGFSANVASESSSTGLGSRLVISEGIIFAKDHFIRVAPQSLVIGKYSRIASYKVGFDVTETIVDYTTDSTLLDPANGSYNYAAPGANRLKLTATLAKYPITATTSTNFVELLRVAGGEIIQSRSKPDYSVINEYIARRHYDTSGNFVVNGLAVRLREHLDQANNQGRYSTDNNGDSTKLIVEVDPGKAFIKGNDVITSVTVPVAIPKSISYNSLEQVNVTPNYGNYLTVDEAAGVWDVNNHGIVSLRTQAVNAVSNTSYSTDASVIGNEIGKARVKHIEHISGTKGSAAAKYKLYLYDIEMANDVFTSVRSLHLDNSGESQANAVCDIVPGSSGDTALSEVSFNRSIFNLPVSSTKTLRDTTGNIDTNFTFLKKFNVTIGTDGTFSLATGAVDETFPFSTGIISDTNTQTNFHVVFNDEVASAGTVDTGSITNGANTITGLTAADTKFNIGDVVVLGGESYSVSAVAASSLSTLNNSSSTHTTVAVTKTFKSGQVIDMAGVGGDAANRTINITSATNSSFDIQETLASSVSATVITEITKVDGQEIAKAYNSNRFVQIRVTDNAGSTTGPWDLGFSDAHKIISVRKKTGNTAFTTTSEGVEVTSDFLLDNGQTDNLYRHGALKLAPNKTAAEGDVYLVKLNYFSHDTSQGIGYFSVDSYPIDDSNAANTTAITTQEIPIYRSPVHGSSHDLRDSIDIRPRITDTATDATVVGSASINPAVSTAIDTVSGGLRYMAPNENMTADLDYYLPRKDLVTMSPDGALKITFGAADLTPAFPDAPDEHLMLAKLDVAPYPSLSTRVAQQYSRFDQACSLVPARTERYTMKDIGTLRDRIDNIEYYTRLSLLEDQATNLKFAANTGIDRFKNGVMVDSFSGHNIGNVLDPDYKISIDRLKGEMRPPFTMNSIDLDFQSSNSANIILGPRDARITVSGTDVYTVGETVTAGAASGKLAYQVGRRLYLEDVSGTYVASSTATGGTSTSSGTISDVSTPGSGKLASITYSHRKAIEQKFASTTRNAAGLFWNFLAKITLNPEHDFWMDTVTAPDLVVNFDNTNDNIAAGGSTWTESWGDWSYTWYGEETVLDESVKVYVDTNSPLGGPAGPDGRILGVQEIKTSLISTPGGTATRTGVRTGVIPKTTYENIGSKVINTSVIPFMRSRVINVTGRGFKPNARVYAFFDGIDVNSYTTPTNSSFTATAAEGTALVTDSNGDLYCKYRLPNSDTLRFRTGERKIRFSDSPTNESGSGNVTTSGEATYSSRGSTQSVQNTIAATRTYETVQETIYDQQTISSTTQTVSSTKSSNIKLTPQNIDGENRVNVQNITGTPEADQARASSVIQSEEVTGDELELYWKYTDNGFGDWCYGAGDDPIVQTFTIGNFNNVTLSSGVYLTKFDLFFATKDATRPVFVEIREVDPSTGFITPRIVPLSRITLEADDINTSSDGSAVTPVHFTSPIFLMANKEYAICIKPAASNPNVAVWVSRLGGTDTLTGERINKQPYVGVMFASSNDRVWSPVQEEDLKFNMYIANFAKNTTATAVFKNQSKEVMQIASSNTFNIVGEQVVGDTTITSVNTVLSVNTGLVLVGNTSGANGLIVSQSSNTFVVKDVSTASKYTAGERVNVVLNGIKQEPHTTIHTAVTPTGDVLYFDPVNQTNTYLHLDNISGAFANNMQIKGQTTGQTSSILALENIEIDTARLNTGFLAFEGSSVSASARFCSSETARDDQYRTLSINKNTNFRTPKYLLSKTLESNIGGVSSGEVKFTMSTNIPSIGPVLDIERVNLLLVNNTVNNDAANETSATGGNAVARYITRTMELLDGQDAEDIRVRLQAYRPQSTDIKVYYKILNKDDSDAFSERSWVLMNQTTVSTVYSSEENENDYKIFDYEVPVASLSGTSNQVQYTNSQNVTYTGYKYLAIKVVLTAEASGVVPKVNELMSIALQA
tara:strand:+ start:703 stop:6999 length:6297 start_codon:yes stop_codon:yes gene_type:complete